MYGRQSTCEKLQSSYQHIRIDQPCCRFEAAQFIFDPRRHPLVSGNNPRYVRSRSQFTSHHRRSVEKAIKRPTIFIVYYASSIHRSLRPYFTTERYLQHYVNRETILIHFTSKNGIKAG